MSRLSSRKPIRLYLAFSQNSPYPLLAAEITYCHEENPVLSVKFRSWAIISTLTVAACTSYSQGTVVYDQVSFTGSPQGDQFTSITADQPMGQSFTPSLSTVGFIDLALYGAINGQGATVHINLLANSITGPVLGTSDSVFVAGQSFGAVTFNFNTAVAVTPGTMYFFQPIVEAGGGDVETPAISFLGYPGGTAFSHGTAVFTADLEFQEGVYVPEPSTWALLLLGAGALWFLRRKL